MTATEDSEESRFTTAVGPEEEAAGTFGEIDREIIEDQGLTAGVEGVLRGGRGGREVRIGNSRGWREGDSLCLGRKSSNS